MHTLTVPSLALPPVIDKFPMHLQHAEGGSDGDARVRGHIEAMGRRCLALEPRPSRDKLHTLSCTSVEHSSSSKESVCEIYKLFVKHLYN